MTELFEILTKLNPWWQDKKIGDTGIRREKYHKKIKKYHPKKELLIIKGVRRAGKTTLLKQTIKDLLEQKTNPTKILFINFDEPDINTLDKPINRVLKTYTQEVNPGKAHLFLDEIQNINQWEKTIKALYDQGEHNITLTGSTSKLLESNLGGLLSGRYLTINITPLDFREYLQFNHIKPPEKNIEYAAQKNKIMNKLKEYLTEGGFPRTVLEQDNELKKQLLTNYYESILYRDVLLAHEVRHTKALKELLHYLISNFTSPYTYEQISKTLGLDYNTVKDYISYLTESGTLNEVNYFSYSLKTQSREPKKPYCIDNGLRNAVSFKFSEDYGRLAENLIYNELKKQNKQVYYWRGRREVDFVVKEGDNRLEAINVTYTDDIKKIEVEGLKEFKEKHPNKTKKLTLITKDQEKKEEEITYTPLWKWLLETP